ncbi:type II secretion system F family protein [Klebsiella pneumoniae]
MATKRLWRWRGIDVQGAPCQGMLWQTKRLEVLQHLQQQRVIPLAVRRCAVKQSLWHPRYSCETIRQLASLLQARALIVQGEPIWQALSRCGGFTPLCLQLIRTGESAGALDQMLENLAHHHRQQTYQRADSLAAHLEPMMLVITGSLVGILVVAMYLPVFHLGDAIGGAGG